MVIVVRHGISPRILWLKVQRCWLVQVWTVILFFRSEGSIASTIRSNTLMWFLSSLGRAGFLVGIPLVGNRKQDFKLNLNLIRFSFYMYTKSGKVRVLLFCSVEAFLQEHSVEAFLGEHCRIRFKELIEYRLSCETFL
jgi:hypothetical protein